MNKSKWSHLIIIFVLLYVLAPQPAANVRASADAAPLYVFPVPGSSRLNPQTSLIIRYPGTADAAKLSADSFHVNGTLSGTHPGRAVLSDDLATVVFTPDQPFTPGERVEVKIEPDNRNTTYAFDFTVEAQPVSNISANSLETSQITNSNQKNIIQSAPWRNYITLPADFPGYSVNLPATDNQGDYFLTALAYGISGRSYLLIVDQSGDPVFYKALPTGFGLDFKKQPNGMLSYHDTSIQGFPVLDQNYQVQTIYTAKNGYVADLHEFQLLPNNHVVFMIYDTKVVDMSKIVNGGDSQALVTGLVIQELDGNNNVFFEWRSWDHIPITDTDNVINLKAHTIDYVHGNAIDLDWDGNYLVSSRHLDEITKINRSTGEIIWRLGGKQNQFTFTNVDISTTLPFSYQHDIRRLANGHITFFNNRDNLTPLYSSADEYEINEDTLTATKVWETRSTVTNTFSFAMGSAQRLSNGNTVIGWGLHSSLTPVRPPDVTEVLPDGSQAFQLTLDSHYTYRAFRFPWQGSPTWLPTAAYRESSGQITIGASWNGDKQTAQYAFYGASTTLGTPQLLGTAQRTGFETQYTLADSLSNYCYFEVTALDSIGNPMQTSNKIFNPSCLPYRNVLPVISR